MKCLGVIPARLNSSRLPGKALAEIQGKVLIQWVWEQATKTKSLSELVIATDSEEILSRARSFGAKVMMTSSSHLSGTDRVAEAAKILRKDHQKFDLVANIQGDMPFINPKVIDDTVKSLREAETGFGMATVAVPLLDQGEFLKASVVKVALGNNNRALYFSRAPVPFWRDPPTQTISESSPWGYKHLGLYVFRADVLNTISSLPPAPTETAEKLEQLRALSAGIEILVHVAKISELTQQIEVDTQADLERARNM